MAWAKLHTDILGDVKMMRAARKGAKGLHLFPWLIAFAKEADDDGRLTVVGESADARDIADQIPGVTVREVQACIASCLTIGILTRGDDGVLSLTAWDRRSGTKASDTPSAIHDRVKRHREKKRNALQPRKRNALQGVSSNAREKEVETEGEVETEKETPISPSGTSDFGRAWDGYPPRAGSNPRREAEQAWQARIRTGVTAEQMLAGVERYRAYCDASGKTGTEYVMQAKRFFGPSAPFDEPWTVSENGGDDTAARVAKLLEEQEAADRRSAELLARRAAGAGV